MPKIYSPKFLYPLFFSILQYGPLYSATITVTSTSDSGSGSLRDAINFANSNPGTTIEFSAGLGAIKLENNLPPILQSNTIIAGNSVNSPQTIQGSTSSPTAVFCVLENLTGIQLSNLVITDVSAIGGPGGTASLSAGGGGMGAGAGLLVASGSIVEISNVNFTNNIAQGGVGGTGDRVALFVDGGSGGGGGSRGYGGESKRVLNGTSGAGGGGGFEGNGGASKSSGASGGAGGGGQFFNGADSENTPGAGGGGQSGAGTSTGSGCNLGTGASTGGSGGASSGGGGGGAGAKFNSGTVVPTEHGNCGGDAGGPSAQPGADSPSNSTSNGGPGGNGGYGSSGGGGGGGGSGGDAQKLTIGNAGNTENQQRLLNGLPGGGGDGGYGGGGGASGGQKTSVYGYINFGGPNAGNGGKWGGGGGSSFSNGGNGGFGGGGGGGCNYGPGATGIGGIGGFGGGGGGSIGTMYVGNPTLGQGSVFGGGYGGGSNGNGVGGGGGAGLGGAIFVDNGGILSITDAAFVGNKAIGGAAGKGNDSKKSGTAGQGLGDDLFLLSGSTTSFASTSGTLTISNPILSDLGAAGGSLTSGGVIIGPGAGTVSFPEGNTYTGGTTIQGTLMVSTDTVQPGTGGSLGYYDPQNSPGSITFNGGTLVTTNTTAPTYFTTDRLITLNGSGTLSPSTGSNGTFNGVISGTGPLIISGGGTVFPTAQNTYTGGTVVNGSLSISSDGNLGAPTGLLTMNAGSFLLMTNNVVTNSNRQVNLANSFANFWVGSGLSSTINGQITGPGILFKDQPGNLTLTNGTNNYAGGTYVNGGSLTVTSASLPVSNGAQLSGHLIFDQGFDGTYAGTITNFLTGTGFVTKTGTGIVTLNNTNTYSGGTTIIEGGISIGSASNIGTGPIQFTGNSSLLLTAPVNLTQNLSINQNVIATIGDGGAPNTSTFSGLISGAGALNLNMTTTGRLNLANPQANTYSGGTLLQSGILGIANGNNLGTGPITFSGNSTIALMAPLQIPATAEIFINGGVTATIDDGGFSSTLNGPISDGTPAGGALQKIGTGVLTMVAPSSYTGLTTIAQGTLAFQGNGAVSSQSNILVNAGATLDISQITPQSFSASNVSGNGTIGLGNKILNMNTSTAATFAGNITDTAISGLTGGSLVVNQNGINGVYTLSGVNTYTGGTTVNGGTLAITALSAFPAGTDLAVNNGATFDITALASTLSIGNLRGNPGIINLGSNALQTNITQDSSFSSTGSGINGTPGSTLIKNGPAKLTLIGQNNYTDGTTINNGTLGIFRDDSLGLVTGNLNFNGGTLSVEDTFSTTRNYNIMGGGGTVDTPLPDTRLTVSSGILGSGILTKKGVGEMILTGNSAAFSGSVIVDEGFLTVLNNLPVAVTVNPAGILKGTGPIGNGATTLTNSGIVSPGNSIGTLAVVGDYVQTSQGHYLAEINDQGASDLISITGTATLDGALDVLPLQGAYFANSGIVYTVLDAAGGRTGTFSSFNVLDPEHTLKLTVIYTPSLVLLTSATNRFFLQTQIKKHNPKEVARYLESLQYYQNGQPIPGQEDLISVIVNLSKLPGPQLVNALDQLHPAQFGEFGLVNSDIKSLIASIVNRSPLENACTHAFELHRCGNASVWIEPFGLNINLKPRNDQRGFHAQTIGALLGADYTNSNGVVTGIAIGSNTTYLKWSGGMGHAHTPSGFLTLFSNWNNEWAYLEGSIIGGYDYFSTVRHIHFPGENRKAKSKHSGFDWGIHVGAKYKVAVGTLNCSPFVNLDCDTLYQDKFSEHGADSLNLEVQKKSFSMLRIEEGFSISRSFVTSEGRITPTAWISMVTTTPLYNRHYTSSMQGQDKSFRVWTYRSTINRLSPGIELVWSTRHGIVLSGRFSAEFGTGISTQKGDLRLEWNF